MSYKNHKPPELPLRSPVGDPAAFCKVFRTCLFALALLPMAAWGQHSPLSPVKGPGVRASSSSRSAARDLEGTNATTLTVLRLNCPKNMPEADWLRLMELPVNRSLFPLRVTQGMLDTLDGREMDLRFQYVLVGDMQMPAGR